MNNSQRGSISWFVIMAIVLVAVAALVMYGARQFMVSQQSPISDDTVAVNTTRESREESNQSNDQKPVENSDKTQKPDKTGSDNNASQPTNGGDGRDVVASQHNSSNTVGLSTRSSAENDNLPTTGPEESFVALMVGGLTFGIVAYNRSRRLV